MAHASRGLVIAAACAAVASACGDNTSECGPGTQEADGLCLPSSSVVCGAGTKLENGQCILDPIACQAGTVLIAGRCLDPSADIVVDLEESAEPNGLAVATGVEPSSSPAGVLTVGPIDTSLVVHGSLVPFRDLDADGQLDPDVDSYRITISAPGVLEISVDGVGGALGGFYLIGDPAGPVASFERYGLGVRGDTAHRRLYVPAAGTYTLAITDVRALAIGRNPPPAAGANAAAGGTDAAYYASITARAMPAATVLPATPPSPTGSLAADQVATFTASLASGTRIRATMPGPATASVAVLARNAVAGYADERVQPPAPAQVTVTGITPADTALIIVDTVYNYGPAPESFTIVVTPP